MVVLKKRKKWSFLMWALPNDVFSTTFTFATVWNLSHLLSKRRHWRLRRPEGTRKKWLSKWHTSCRHSLLHSAPSSSSFEAGTAGFQTRLHGCQVNLLRLICFGVLRVLDDGFLASQTSFGDAFFSFLAIRLIASDRVGCCCSPG